MSEVLTQSIIILGIVVQAGLLFFWAYWFIISLFGFGKPKVPKAQKPTKKFAILIPAHNEESVIENLVENLLNMKYPNKLYDVIVIADNCTDKTAELSLKAGAKVIETTSLPDEPKGKPHAIRKALEQLGDYENQYDAIAFFDADNLVSLNYLEEMNNHLMQGDQLIQCYLDSKNPEDNWITLSYASSYYYMNRSWQLAKSKLGLGNAVGGTGFCVDTKLLKEVGWTARSLTEDLEFQIQCLLAGVPAKWCHTARVYDEKPTGFWASCVQRLRWARGHWDVCLKYSGPLIKKSIFKLDILSFDGLMYLINPGKIVIAAGASAMGLLSKFELVPWFESILPWWSWFILVGFQIWYVGYSIVIDTAKPLKKLFGLLYLPIFNISYIPLFIWAFITRRNKSWNRTDHSRSIDFNSLNDHTVDKVNNDNK